MASVEVLGVKMAFNSKKIRIFVPVLGIIVPVLCGCMPLFCWTIEC